MQKGGTHFCAPPSSHTGRTGYRTDPNQNGRSSSDIPSGEESSASDVERDSAAAGAPSFVAADPLARGGQTTPSHDLSRHLKSGAFGFRLERRLSHMRPPHLGHDGVDTGSATVVSVDGSGASVAVAAAVGRTRFATPARARAGVLAASSSFPFDETAPFDDTALSSGSGAPLAGPKRRA